MIRSISLFLAIALLTVASPIPRTFAVDSARPEISFEVHKMREENVEGPDVGRSFFTIGDKRMIIGVPKGCQLSSGDGFLLLPEDTAVDGEIRVSRSPFTAEFDLAANALKYRDAGNRTLPVGATNPHVAQPVMNPYPYNGWKSLEFKWTYGLYGRPMVRTVSYLNLEDGVQVVITTLAAEKDAGKVEKMAKQFIASWWVMTRAT